MLNLFSVAKNRSLCLIRTEHGDILPYEAKSRAYDVDQKQANLSSVCSSAPTIGTQKILSLEIHRLGADGAMMVAGEHGGGILLVAGLFLGSFVQSCG